MDVLLEPCFRLWLGAFCLVIISTGGHLSRVDWTQSRCPQPDPVANTYRDVGADFDVIYTCYDSYDNVSGDLHRRCQENGSYSGAPPACVLKCPPPVLPDRLYTKESLAKPASGGDQLNALCVSPIAYGDKSPIECSEELGQWEPWKLFCGNTVSMMNIQQSSNASGSTCWKTEQEVRPYWKANFSISQPPKLYDIAAVLLVMGNSSKDDVSLTIEILGEEDQLCGHFVPSNTTLLSTFICMTTNGTQPWGYGIKITANFSHQMARHLEICKITVHGRSHKGQCSPPPALPMLTLTVSAAQFFTFDKIVYVCRHPLLPLAGSGISECTPFGQWTYPSLICTDEENLAAGRKAIVTSEGTSHLFNLTDGDVTTGVVSDKNDITYRVMLGKLVEVKIVTALCSGNFEVTVSAVFIKTGKSGTCLVTQWNESLLTSAECHQMYVADAVDIRIQTPQTEDTPGQHSLLEVRVFGRVFDNPLSCLRSPTGVEYKGYNSISASGRACVPWTEVISAVPGFEEHSLPDDSAEDAGNFCRNPRGDYPSVMCYVKMEAHGKELQADPCDVTLCALSCLVRQDGQDYAGYDNTTIDGSACANWSHPNIPFRRWEDFAWTSLDVAPDRNWKNHNYCRNPGGAQSEPWCYTDAENLTVGFCGLPICETDSRVSSTSTEPLQTASTPAFYLAVSSPALSGDATIHSSLIRSLKNTAMPATSAAAMATVRDNRPLTITASPTAVLETLHLTPDEFSRGSHDLDQVVNSESIHPMTPSSRLLHVDHANSRTSYASPVFTDGGEDDMVATSSVLSDGTDTLLWPSSDAADEGLNTWADAIEPSLLAAPSVYGSHLSEFHSQLAGQMNPLPTTYGFSASVIEVGVIQASSVSTASSPGLSTTVGPKIKEPTGRAVKAPGFCPCTCARVRSLRNGSNSQYLASALWKLQNELQVPFKGLSSTIRSKTSAPDNRLSSVATGIVGISILGLVALLLIIADLLTFGQFLYKLITRRHRAPSA